MPAPSDSPRPARILVRGVNWLGDAVMTTPALERLREAHPRAHIALLTAAKLADLWRHHPDIDQVLTFEPDESVFAVARHLRPLDFDTALVLPNSPRSALEVFLARIPRRVGHARPWRNWLLTQSVPPRVDETPMRKRSAAEIQRLIASPPHVGFNKPQAHHIHQYLHLAAALGAKHEAAAPRLAVTDAEVEAISTRFGFLRGDAPSRPRLLGVNAGAEYGPAKRWPRERFIEAAIKIQAETKCHCWIFGGPAEVEFARALADAIAAAPAAPLDSVRCLAGQTPLRELCAALAACDALLTNDSGPMHVAAAVGTPVVVPFGSTSPALTAPGLPGDPRHQLLEADAPCSPCFLRECPIDFRCMTGLNVDRVTAAVVKALALK
jgi:heptosyltransferase-2